MDVQFTAEGNDIKISNTATVDKTIRAVVENARRDADKLLPLALSLVADTDFETCNNIWMWVKQHIRYVNDKDGVEQVRTPINTYTFKKGDCDDMTGIVSALLFGLGIKHKYKIVDWGTDGWDHIYPVAVIDGHDVAIDCIPESRFYNKEIKYKKQFATANLNGINKMELHVLDGVNDLYTSTSNEALNTNVLAGYDDDENVAVVLAGWEEAGTGDKVEHILSGASLAKLNEIDAYQSLMDAREGLKDKMFASYKGADELDGFIKSWANTSRADKIAKLKSMSNTIDLQSERYENATDSDSKARKNIKDFYGAIAGQIEYSNTIEKSTEPIEFTQSPQNKYNINAYTDSLSGMDEFEKYVLANYVGDSTKALSGKRRGKGLFNKIKDKIKTGIKNTSSAIKKGIKSAVKLAVKFNPATILARNGILLCAKLNLFKTSTRLKPGYLTAQEAQEAGLNAEEHAKAVDVVKQWEKIFETIGGKAENLKNAVQKSRAKKSKELRGGLGVAPAAAAPVAAAMPFLAKLKTLLAKINFKKLFDKAKGKIKEENEAEETETEPTPTEISEIDNTASDSGEYLKEEPTPQFTVRNGKIASLKNTTINSEMTEENKLTNTVAATALSTTEPIKKNFFMTAWEDKTKRKWVIVSIIGLVLVIIISIWLYLKSKKKKGLSGRRRRRTALNGQRKYAVHVRKIAPRNKRTNVVPLQLSGGSSRRKSVKRKTTRRKR